MKILALIILMIAGGAAHAAPLCVRMETLAMVPCYSDGKIDAAQKILRRRGHRVDRDFIVSVEVNEGKFRDAKALADWITWGG